MQKNDNSSLFIQHYFSVPQTCLKQQICRIIIQQQQLCLHLHTHLLTSLLPSFVCLYMFLTFPHQRAVCACKCLWHGAVAEQHMRMCLSSDKGSLILHRSNSHVPLSVNTAVQDPEFSRYQHKTAAYKTNYRTIGRLSLICSHSEPNYGATECKLHLIKAEVFS